MLEVLAGLMITSLPDVHTNVFCAVNMSVQSKQIGLVLVLCQIKSDAHCQGCRAVSHSIGTEHNMAMWQTFKRQDFIAVHAEVPVCVQFKEKFCSS